MLCTQCQSGLPPAARFCPACGAPVRGDDTGPVDATRAVLESNLGFQYRIERILGRGGMGAVYLAHELALDRPVAIKVLPPEQASASEVRERFRREARTAARLSHPNIVPLHTFGEVGGLMYFVMGYVEGESLGGLLKRERRLPSEDTRELMAEMAGALEYAHRQGVVHRDIKPDNILIDEHSRRPVLTDFGIAKARVGDEALTITGALIGTPQFMSPEQAAGRADVDGRSDIYSLGVVAYLALSGRLPFEADTPFASAMQRITVPPRPLRTVVQQDVPDDLIGIVSRCLATSRDDRWPDARALKRALTPDDDDYEPDLPPKLLRLGVRVVPPSVLAVGWTQLFAKLSGTPGPWGRVTGFFAGQVIVFTLLALGALIHMRRRGESFSVIGGKALQQPRWWVGWYPRPWRRRGDVWDRLPPQLQRWRIYWSIFILYQGTVFIPWMIGHLTVLPAGMFNTLTTVIAALVFVMLIALLVERRRSTTWARKTLEELGEANVEDTRAFTAPTWRRSEWARAPLQALLRPMAR
jgi:hypothetical protein